MIPNFRPLTCDPASGVASVRPCRWRGQLVTFDFRPVTHHLAFTLIELVVVMLVIGILTVLAIEKFTSTPSWSAPLAANELSVHLRYIRNLALTREQTTKVVFNKALNHYVVYTNEIYVAKDPVTQAPWTNKISERFSGVSLADVNIGVVGGTNLYFSETGIPCYNNTNSPLTTPGTIVFNSGQTVTIVQGTGYIKLE